MSNWRLYLILLVAGFMAGHSVSANETAPALSSPNFTLPVCAFSAVPSTTDIPCEQAPSLLVSCPNPLSLSTNVKDFQDYMDNPVLGDQRTERCILAYVFFTEVFRVSKSLSQLQRLNI